MASHRRRLLCVNLEPAGLTAIVAALALPLMTIYQVDQGWPRQGLALLAGGIVGFH